MLHMEAKTSMVERPRKSVLSSPCPLQRCSRSLRIQSSGCGRCSWRHSYAGMSVASGVGERVDDVPLLMREDVAANLLLLLLDQVYICEHAVGLEPCGELSSGHCIQVQTREGDELKDEAVRSVKPR